MALIEIEDLEKALGEEIPEGDVERAEYYINLVSAYIAAYTGVSFEPHEDVTIRRKADYYGRVELPGGNVSEVTEVKHYLGDPAWGWQWDGIDEVYGLKPMVAVDITYSYGYDSIPDDITFVAIEAVKRLFKSPDGQDVGPLSKFKVGDIEESYNIPEGVLAGGLFNDLEKVILDSYRGTEGTWHIGFSQPNTFDRIPQSDTALYE